MALIVGSHYVDPTPDANVSRATRELVHSLSFSFVPPPINWPLVMITGALLMMVFSIYHLIEPFKKRCTTELAVTNRRVIYKTGFIRRISREINIAQVESVIVKQGIMGRLVGYGEVTVVGTGGSWDPMPTISKPVEFRSHIVVSHQIHGAP
jgi:uncharacterized membrane protein YdbT with pleckstrin-like domain